MKTNGLGRGLILLAMLGAMPLAASAQSFSGSYLFLKAVRDADGAKVTEMTNQPGSTVLESRDPQTGEGALQIVVKRRDTTWLGFLLGSGAKPDFKDRDGNTPLILAASMGFPEGAQLLLDHGARVDLANASGETPLIRAVQARDLSTVRVLLQAGANPRIGDNATGMSAHDYATRDPRAATILKLLDTSTPKPKSTMGPRL